MKYFFKKKSYHVFALLWKTTIFLNAAYDLFESKKDIE